jgi:glycosyltransferase involved in cell wall biosynthesis/GT2 family glycosyltransferase
MSPPLVSINMCTYNSSKYVRQTLQSVFAQTLQNFEIVIVDDGSTDGTPELIAREFPDARIKIVRQQHVTLRLARPIALAHSEGDYIAFLDSDDLWTVDKLERMVRAADDAPDAGLLFSDCEVIDAAGVPTGRFFSDQFDYAAIDLRGTNGHLELLRRGNFIASPAPLAPAAAIRAVGGFNHAYRHVNDFELWLRLARRFPLKFVDAPLAYYRVHDGQFTQRRWEITLPEQCSLLHPIIRSSSFPPDVRIALGDNLLGQHRLAVEGLRRQRRHRLALKAALGAVRYPDRLRDSFRHRLHQTRFGFAAEVGIAAALVMKDLFAKGRRDMRRVLRAPRRLARWWRGQPRPAPARLHVWVDGTSLGRARTGYFNFLAELIRQLARRRDDGIVVHVTTQASGRAALVQRLAQDLEGVRFHGCGWRAAHWSQIHHALFGGQPHSRLAESFGHSRLRYSARLVRFLWRRFPAPRWHTEESAVEIVVWRGRFRWRNSHRIAVVQDLTTRLRPELHTPGNVAEFEEFLGYVQRHAHTIATVSNHSRRDIIDRVMVCPESVNVLPMPVHPQYEQPQFSRGFVAAHGITMPYILCVSTIEPRKNLRRLIKAFELLKHEEAAKEHVLVLAGDAGWDPTFHEAIVQSDVYRRLRIAGFVPLDHLPSLYHFASAVVYPSLYEGFGIPVLEAMCSSAVVLASRESSLPEVLGPDGMQFDPYSTEDMAAAILRAITLPLAEQDAYRRRCRRRAEAHLEKVAREGPLPGLPEARVAART